jgi:hypothetical protein
MSSDILKIYFGFENIERILKEKENTILHGITKKCAHVCIKM